jgi:hypothetical protein
MIGLRPLNPETDGRNEELACPIWVKRASGGGPGGLGGSPKHGYEKQGGNDAAGAPKMPNIVVRRKIGRRTGGWKLRLRRWLRGNGPQVAVVAAFVAACILGLVAVSVGLNALEGSPSGPESAPAQ